LITNEKSWKNKKWIKMLYNLSNRSVVNIEQIEIQRNIKNEAASEMEKY
jgi:hypothetical protein